MLGGYDFDLVLFHLVVDGALDCSIYSSELDIVNLNPFYVRLNPSGDLTSVYYNDALKQMQQMTISNDKNPSSSIFCLINLQQLTLTNTNLTLLPEIKNLGKLSVLKITSDNGAVGAQLPSEISQLKSLGTLALTNIINLESLPVEIEELTSLQTLTLTQIPKLVSIAPSQLGQLTNLVALDLVDVPQVDKLPYPMENFQKLTRLTVTNTSVPSLELQNLKVLSTVKVSSNIKIGSIGLANLSSLSSLEISKNDALQTLIMQNLPVLQSLSISSNQRLNSIVCGESPGSRIMVDLYLSDPGKGDFSEYNCPRFGDILVDSYP